MRRLWGVDERASVAFESPGCSRCLADSLPTPSGAARTLQALAEVRKCGMKADAWNRFPPKNSLQSRRIPLIFDTATAASVAQSGRASPCQGERRGFESLRSLHLLQRLTTFLLLEAISARRLPRRFFRRLELSLLHIRSLAKTCRPMRL